MSDLNASSARIFASVVAREPDAETQLFHRYLQRLCRLARTRLVSRLAKRMDPEDIVLSAYRSFFVSARAGRFSIQESGDLWALLAKITLRKLYRSAAHHSAEMRSMHREVSLPESTSPHEWLIAEQPSAEEAVALADEVESVLRTLSPPHRRVVELRLQGELMNEIARQTGIPERTIRRILSDLETRMQNSHAVHPQESIRVIPADEEMPRNRNPKRFDEVSLPEFSFEDLLLQKLIGAGGMGKVYRAVSRINGHLFAVKFLHKSLQDKSGIVEQFLAEAAIVKRLSHPGIVRVEGLGQTNARAWFIVMQLIEGGSLAEEISKQLPSIKRSLSWIRQVAMSLQHAHNAGVVHCDLKPANVLLNPSGQAVISDFGLARFIASGHISETTVAGTASWMAPEQVDPVFGPVTTKTDIYGLGALLYSMLTGQPPFRGDRLADILGQVVSSTPVAMSRFRGDVSEELESLCLRCLARSPADRIQSVAEFLSALQALSTS